MDIYLNTIISLLNALTERGIPAQIESCWDGWKLVFPWANDADIACHSYTNEVLESYGFPWDEDNITRDSANGMFCRLVALWEENN